MANAALLPNGKQQFFDDNGDPLVDGLVYFYVPNTTTFKDTWQDKDRDALNTNPVELDARGEAVIYGSGVYRQVVYDADMNLIWDKEIQDPATATAGILHGTSATSTLIGTGSKSFLTEIGLGFADGMFVSIVDDIEPTRYMFGVVTNYDEFGGILTVDVQTTSGSGTYDDWLISLSGSTGPAGPNGAGQLGPRETVSAATTTNLGSASAYDVLVSGSGVTITSLGNSANTDNPFYFVIFDNVNTLTHNATSLILPGGVNIATANGDTALFEFLGSSNWKCWFYQRAGANPLPLPGAANNVLTSNGTSWISSAQSSGIDRQTFTASGTWTKPTGFAATSMVLVEAWGGGASGARLTAMATGCGGGGGGSYKAWWTPLSALGATETVTIGAGGAAVSSGNEPGVNGGQSSFGVHVVAYGGSGGGDTGTSPIRAGGAGGGIASTSAAGTRTNDTGYGEGYGGDESVPTPAAGGTFIGGGGGYGEDSGAGNAGGNSIYGGGGGGGTGSTGTSSGGSSSFGGAGGAGGSAAGGNGADGTAPGGGGGASSGGTSGAGARGEIRVTVFS